MSKYSKLTNSKAENYYWDYDENDSDDEDAQSKDSSDDDNYTERLNSTPSNSVTSTLRPKFQKLTSRLLKRMPKDNKRVYSMVGENKNDDFALPEHTMSELTMKLQKIDDNDKKSFKRALKNFLSPETINKYSLAAIKWKLYSIYPDKIKLISKVLKKKIMDK
ncbi:uncharacterized protein [Chelonus insularis]|uniref:uncharacterized protein n=1 Tax=Chelonus insularis TaxID=460826 RepID=UPI00158A1B40|nr:uncharacterized protein LOC118063710 [Chelonus insularis]KAG8148381.1 BVpp26-like-2 protein [Chelonus insularis]